MIKAALASLLLLAALAHPAAAQFTPLQGAAVTTTGGCSQATTFLARTAGESSGTRTALTTLICGMVTSGLITGDLSTTGCGALFDAVYIMAVDNATDAKLNLCGTNWSLTPAGSPVFTADAGYAGVSGDPNSYMSTGITPSTFTGDYTLNSAHVSAWSLTDQEDVGLGIQAAVSDNNADIYPRYTDGSSYCDVNNSGNTQQIGAAVANTLGYYLCTRANSTTLVLYKNGSTVISAASATNAEPATDLRVARLSSRIIAFASLGANETSTQDSSVYSAVCTYLTSVHGSC